MLRLYYVNFPESQMQKQGGHLHGSGQGIRGVPRGRLDGSCGTDRAVRIVSMYPLSSEALIFPAAVGEPVVIKRFS